MDWPGLIFILVGLAPVAWFIWKVARETPVDDQPPVDKGPAAEPHH